MATEWATLATKARFSSLKMSFSCAGEEKVGERCADVVGDVGEIELALVSRAARHDDLWKRGVKRGVAEGFAPGEAGFLVERRGGQALQREVFFKRNMAEHGELSAWKFDGAR